MLTLSNDQLSLSILDPIADQARLGSRFCSGGYIYQINDHKLGHLLSGPSYPADVPSTFDGQGIPEVFEIALGQNDVKVGEDVMVIGTGLVTRVSPIEPFQVRHNLAVKEHAKWDIKQDKDKFTFTTRQQFKNYRLELKREIVLNHRTVHSITTIQNTCQEQLPVRWFAHPFFPLTRDGQYSHFDLEYEVPKNIAFESKDGWIVTRHDYDLSIGLNQPLNMTLGYPLTVRQKHPLLGEVKVECGFPIAFLPVWANQCTFSFEPYFHTILQSNNVSRWMMTYHF